MEGFRVWDGRCSRVPVLAPDEGVQGLGRKVLPVQGSCSGWKGLGFVTEGARAFRFLVRVEGFRVWDGRCSRVSVLAPGGRV